MRASISSEKSLERFYMELGGSDWLALQTLVKQVIQAVESNRRSLNAKLIVPFIETILKKNTSADFDPKDAEAIRIQLKTGNPWDDLKRSGIAALPPGVVFNACEKLIKGLEKVGLFVLREGELESFDRSIGSHGPAWVVEAVKKNLQTHPDLENARNFVRTLVHWTPP